MTTSGKLRVLTALAALLLATAAAASPIERRSDAQSPAHAALLGAAPLAAGPASRPLLYAQVKSLWKNQPQPGQQPPPAAAQQPQPDQPPAETDEPEEEQQPGPAPQQPAQRPGQPPVYGQPGPPPMQQRPGPPPGYAQPNLQLPADGRLQYRGFRVDATAIVGSPQYADVLMSLTRQVDIVMEVGLRPDALRFFQNQVITVRPDIRGPGHFSAREPGIITVAATPADPNKPIVLHEILHAYHRYVIPGGYRNPQILAFYQRAQSVYPPNAYTVKNVQEFFAVTASLYLFGHVNRPPRTREALHQAQPVYYQWLGQLFGMQK
jgi:hypothetical protein